MAKQSDEHLSRHLRVVGVLASIVVGMVALSFAAVPLYDLFCRVTGFGGTTGRADSGAEQVVDRELKIRFKTRTSDGVGWDFKPQQDSQKLKIGETGLAYFTARNTTDEAQTIRAVYNATPVKTAQFINKVECFCFSEQTLAAGESMDMPMQYFVDPEMAELERLSDIKTITLTYTLFPAGDDHPDSNASGDQQAAATPQ